MIFNNDEIIRLSDDMHNNLIYWEDKIFLFDLNININVI
jgi:hypothetical protein